MRAMGTHPILLVEDDDNDVILLKRAFKKAKLANAIEVVSDGEAAIAYLSGAAPYEGRALPELVLLDLKLPRKSGHEVLEWIRAQPG
ncbi:MAG TPA: response regulator, partial [Candidatus Limnocylindrales bacterium]|nr:response regulator [Candidatus Limnocylindrales bacterium]